jgi:hypothetical protein
MCRLHRQPSLGGVIKVVERVKNLDSITDVPHQCYCKGM